ncbi:hypothetical protein TIFTF001_008263 [Ficus carica]|uniref:HMA domain-containing protein n=1 Tax=Ficus carica TaxID=3494 RepID=A0AA88D1K7_FICCA|nr:hypothetical protein TIFTF001_008263 [Ficus carica]
MKGIDLFCASQASTAICLSMDIEASSSSSSSAIQLGGRAIDRHNPIIREGRRAAPCSSQPPINPKSYHQLQKPKKSSTSSKHNDQKKKSTSANTSTSSQAKLGDFIKTRSSSSSSLSSSSSSISVPKDAVGRWSWGATKAADLVTPPGSSRYLLGDTAFLEGLSDYDPVLALVPVGNKRNQSAATTAAAAAAAEKQDQSTATKDSSSSHHSKPPSSNQVVVLRVSLHCRGCEGKVRKHLSRMEGVTSFNIDFAAKKVTVVGDVTPLSVLASISKVKNAQFWTKEVVSFSPAPPPANSSLTILDTKKH